jgi:DNA polymerase I-like protein with 3'-5' exonuclease and polymerase domains
LKRNLLFGVDNNLKRDVINPKEINKIISSMTEKRTVKKSGAGKSIGKIKQTVSILVDEFKKKHPNVLSEWPSNYIIVDTDEKLDRLLRSIEECRRFSYDTETMGLKIWHGDNIVGISFYTPCDGNAWYIPIHHLDCIEPVEGKQLPVEFIKENMAPVMRKKREESLAYSMRTLNSIDDIDMSDEYCGVVTFNGKFDSHVVWINLGIEMPDIAFEGYLASRVLNENEPVNKLKPLCNKWLKQYQQNPLDKFDEIFEKTPCAYFPIWMVGYYACKDAILHWEWMEFAESHIKKRPGLAESYYVIQLQVLPSVIAAERRGMLLDVDRVNANKEEFEGYKVAIEKTIKTQLQELMDKFLDDNPHVQVVNVPPSTKNGKAKVFDRNTLRTSFIPGLNINSPPQLGDLFFSIWGWPTTKKDGKATNEKVMQRLAKQFSVCKSILAYRTVKKMIGTYCDGLLEAISPVDGRVHTSFNPYKAVTNRFSSSDPNLQNIPSKSKKLLIEGQEVKVDFGKKIRRCFIAEEGNVLCSTDYSQIEPRILAVLSGDETMLDAYRNAKDVYVQQAVLFFPGHPEQEYLDNDDTGYKSPWRGKVKAIVLGLNYGMTEVGLAEGLDCTETEAKREIERYFDTFPAIKEFTQSVLDSAYEKGYVEMLYHTKRRLPDLQDSRAWIRSDAERQCVNSIMQGSSAEITKRAMAFIYANRRLRELDVTLISTVHDEVITSIPKANLVEAIPIIKQCMIDACSRLIERGGIVIKVDAEVSEQWYGPVYHWEGHEEVGEDNEKLILEELDDDLGEEESEVQDEYEESVFA